MTQDKVTNEDIMERLDKFENRVEQMEAKFDRKSRLIDELYDKIKGGKL